MTGQHSGGGGGAALRRRRVPAKALGRAGRSITDHVLLYRCLIDGPGFLEHVCTTGGKQEGDDKPTRKRPRRALLAAPRARAAAAAAAQRRGRGQSFGRSGALIARASAAHVLVAPLKYQEHLQQAAWPLWSRRRAVLHIWALSSAACLNYLLDPSQGGSSAPVLCSTSWALSKAACACPLASAGAMAGGSSAGRRAHASVYHSLPRAAEGVLISGGRSCCSRLRRVGGER